MPLFWRQVHIVWNSLWLWELEQRDQWEVLTMCVSSKLSEHQWTCFQPPAKSTNSVTERERGGETSRSSRLHNCSSSTNLVFITSLILPLTFCSRIDLWTIIFSTFNISIFRFSRILDHLSVTTWQSSTLQYLVTGCEVVRLWLHGYVWVSPGGGHHSVKY